MKARTTEFQFCCLLVLYALAVAWAVEDVTSSESIVDACDEVTGVPIPRGLARSALTCQFLCAKVTGSCLFSPRSVSDRDCVWDADENRQVPIFTGDMAKQNAEGDWTFYDQCTSAPLTDYYTRKEFSALDKWRPGHDLCVFYQNFQAFGVNCSRNLSASAVDLGQSSSTVKCACNDSAVPCRLKAVPQPEGATPPTALSCRTACQSIGACLASPSGYVEHSCLSRTAKRSTVWTGLVWTPGKATDQFTDYCSGESLPNFSGFPVNSSQLQDTNEEACILLKDGIYFAVACDSQFGSVSECMCNVESCSSDELGVSFQQTVRSNGITVTYNQTVNVRCAHRAFEDFVFSPPLYGSTSSTRLFPYLRVQCLNGILAVDGLAASGIQSCKPTCPALDTWKKPYKAISNPYRSPDGSASTSLSNAAGTQKSYGLGSRAYVECLDGFSGPSYQYLECKQTGMMTAVFVGSPMCTPLPMCHTNTSGFTFQWMTTPPKVVESWRTTIHDCTQGPGVRYGYKNGNQLTWYITLSCDRQRLYINGDPTPRKVACLPSCAPLISTWYLDKTYIPATANVTRQNSLQPALTIDGFYALGSRIYVKCKDGFVGPPNQFLECKAIYDNYNAFFTGEPICRSTFCYRLSKHQGSCDKACAGQYLAVPKTREEYECLVNQMGGNSTTIWTGLRLGQYGLINAYTGLSVQNFAYKPGKPENFGVATDWKDFSKLRYPNNCIMLREGQYVLVNCDLQYLSLACPCYSNSSCPFQGNMMQDGETRSVPCQPGKLPFVAKSVSGKVSTAYSVKCMVGVLFVNGLANPGGFHCSPTCATPTVAGSASYKLTGVFTGSDPVKGAGSITINNQKYFLPGTRAYIQCNQNFSGRSDQYLECGSTGPGLFLFHGQPKCFPGNYCDRFQVIAPAHLQNWYSCASECKQKVPGGQPAVPYVSDDYLCLMEKAHGSIMWSGVKTGTKATLVDPATGRNLPIFGNFVKGGVLQRNGAPLPFDYKGLWGSSSSNCVYMTKSFQYESNCQNQFAVLLNGASRRPFVCACEDHGDVKVTLFRFNVSTRNFFFKNYTNFRMLNGSSTVKVVDGSKFSLNNGILCVVFNGDSDPVWTHNGSTITGGNNAQVSKFSFSMFYPNKEMGRNGRAVLLSWPKPFGREDAGKYSCSANNRKMEVSKVFQAPFFRIV